MARSTLARSAPLLLLLAVGGCDSELPTPDSQTPSLPPGSWTDDLTAAADVPVGDTGDADLPDTPGDTDDTTVGDTDDTTVADTTDADTTPDDADADADADVGPDPCPPGVLGTTPMCAVASCTELAARDPEAASGIYFALPMDGGAAREVFCEMTQAGGGWTSLVRFDSTQADGCPGDWVASADPDLCVRDRVDGGVRQASWQSTILAWSEIRGFARAYKYSTTDGFYGDPALTTLQDPYVDGLSITTGATQTHLWTYTAGWLWPGIGQHYNCPCAGGEAPMPFVGGHYACEAPAELDDRDQWELGNPMWSGPGVGVHCDVRGDVSWFERHLDAPTTDPVEVRIMANQASSNEDIGVEALTLFVREAERCEGATVGEDEDHDGQVDELGCGPVNPAPSCLAIHQGPGFAPSGVYWLQPQVGGPVLRAYCQMELGGGGWTLAAVCRQGSTGCHDPNAVGSPDSPWHATTAKLSDKDIISLLTSGEQTTLGLWRTGLVPGVANAYEGVSAVVNERPTPSVWSSAPCSTPLDTTWTSRDEIVYDLSVDPSTLVDTALAKQATTLTATAGACGCQASGWSNLAADNCSAGWGAPDENGPSGLNDPLTPEYRADLQLWVR